MTERIKEIEAAVNLVLLLVNNDTITHPLGIEELKELGVVAREDRIRLLAVKNELELCLELLKA